MKYGVQEQVVVVEEEVPIHDEHRREVAGENKKAYPVPKLAAACRLPAQSSRSHLTARNLAFGLRAAQHSTASAQHQHSISIAYAA